MTWGPALLDTDTLSELARGHPAVVDRAQEYLEVHGRLTLGAVTVFERLRGYRDALRRRRPYERQLADFQALVGASIVLPIDAEVADVAATLWAGVGPRRRRALGDILVAATAAANGLALVTRNRRDFLPMLAVKGVSLRLTDWTR